MPYVGRGTYPLTHANQPGCAPLTVSHRQWSCSLRIFFFFSTISTIPLPLVSMSCSHQSSELVSSLTLSPRITRGQWEIPSTSVLLTPGMCFAVWFQPLIIFRRPSILMRKHARLSLGPPHREIQDRYCCRVVIAHQNGITLFRPPCRLPVQARPTRSRPCPIPLAG